MFANIVSVLASVLIVLPSVTDPAPSVGFGPSHDPARLVPDDVIVFFGAHDIQGDSGTSRESAMQAILGEPEVRAFLQRPLAAADGILQTLLMSNPAASGVDNETLDLEAVKVSSLFEADGGGLPIGRLFVALTHVDVPNPAGGGAMTPDVGLVVGIELLDATDLAMVKTLWDGIPFSGSQASHNGSDYFTKQSPGTESIGLAFLGNMAVVSLSETTLHGVMDRFYDTSGSLTSLASSSGYQTMVEAAGGYQAGGGSWFVQVNPVMDLLRTGLSIAMMMEGEAEMLPTVMGLLNDLGMDNMWAGGMSYRDSGGTAHSVSLQHVDLAGDGLVPQMMGAVGPANLDKLNAIPGDAMGGEVVSMGGLGALYDFLEGVYDTFVPEGEKAEVEGMFLSPVFGGVDVRNDIFANIDGTMATYAMPGLAFMGAPATIFSMEMKDPEAFVAAIETTLPALSGVLGEMMGAPGGINLKRSMVGDASFIEIDLSKNPALSMTMMSPAMAIQGNELTMCLESADALKQLLNGEIGDGSAMDDDRLADFVRQLQRDGDVVRVKFTDSAEAFAVIYNQVAGPMQMMAGGMGDVPLDISLMPSEQSISQHLDMELQGQVFAGNDPSLTINRSKSQFTGSDFMPLIAVAAVFGIGVAAEMPMEGEVAEPEISPEEIARADIAGLRASLTVYKISERSYPDALHDLLRSLPDYPNGCYPHAELPSDPWGGDYLYRIDGRKAVVWSAGPNGIDEDGEGDDVTRSR